MDIVLMGDSNAGRSSIMKVIFQKIMAAQTVMLGETTKMEAFDFRISKLEFKIYDFPAKYDFSDPPPNEQMILKNASAMIYVMNPQSDTERSI